MSDLTTQERKNVDVVNRFVEEVWNKGNFDAVYELLAEDYTNNAPAGSEPTREGVKQTAGMIRAAFPDLRLTAEDTLVEGDKVAQRWSGRGTHKGELMGVPPSGNEVTYGGISIYRVQDGQIVEDFTIVDLMGIMQQIGAVPEAG